MYVKQTRLQELFEGTKQYVIPLFQRPYDWGNKEWNYLWDDLCETHTSINDRSHFFGSIVTMKDVRTSDEVSSFLVIDGQQRLTTIFIILILLRNKASELGDESLADEINNTLIVNQYKKDEYRFKLRPTRSNLDSYKMLVEERQVRCSDGSGSDALISAYRFFERKMRSHSIGINDVKKTLMNRFVVVSILLEDDDNPHLVFEGLNAKGRPLTQGDLIRNHVFMNIERDRRESLHREYWEPIVARLGEDFTEYIRIHLMQNGQKINHGETYLEVRKKLSRTSEAVSFLKELYDDSLFYMKIVHPEKEKDHALRRAFSRFSALGFTAVHTFLLTAYRMHAANRLGRENFLSVMDDVENYLVRRFICLKPSAGLHELFCRLSVILTSALASSDDPKQAVRDFLQGRDYPDDAEFVRCFRRFKFKGTERSRRARFILESIEAAFNRREEIRFDNLTLEHIMPRVLSPSWKECLGDDFEKIHDKYLHLIGNLTLSGYNSELSNCDFDYKKQIYAESRLEINRMMVSASRWGFQEIEERADFIINKSLEVWPCFFAGDSSSGGADGCSLRFTRPACLKIMERRFDVNNWRDVLQRTFDFLYEYDPTRFQEQLCTSSKLVSRDPLLLREHRPLRDGFFIEVNMSADRIYQVCRQAMASFGLEAAHWQALDDRGVPL